MIAKGNTHDNGARLARYIVTGKEGEFAELWELRGFALRDITDAFRSVHVTAQKSQCKQPFFHVQVRNPEGETLTRSQWTMAAEKIEGMLGLGDQPRAIAVHTDRETGHEHIHIAWSRIDPETLKAKALPFFKLRLKKACRELESALELSPVSSDRKSSIEYAPKRHEEQQAIRLGVPINDVREVLKAWFERSDCGASFRSALADEGVILARGDRRDFVAVDRTGGMHALGKRILGASAAEIRLRFSDLSPDRLPSVEEARGSLRTGGAPRSSMTEIPGPRPVGRQHKEGEIQFMRVGAPAPVSPSIPPSTPAQSLRPDLPPPTAIPACVHEPATPPGATGNEAQSRRLGASLKLHFRATVRALFKRSPSPQPQTRRRRTGETVGTFRIAARNLLRPIVRLPAVARAVGFLNDALPWLHLWEWNEVPDQDFAANAANGDTDKHLSPHP
jgi:Relaxase/Mobilisation nuclease domain